MTRDKFLKEELSGRRGQGGNGATWWPHHIGHSKSEDLEFHSEFNETFLTMF